MHIQTDQAPVFAAAVLDGIGSFRVAYVKQIFDKYKKLPDYSKIAEFDPEEFVAQIDTLKDAQLKGLSNVPLYLSIMCYVYAGYLKSKDDAKELDHLTINQSPDQFWSLNLSNLLDECVRVLLKDKDLQKLKEFPKQGILRRRSDFYKEKVEFLPFFALELIKDEKTVFNLDYITRKSLYYFQKINSSGGSSRVLSSFENTKNSNPNFAQQLLYSGLFITSTIDQEESLYDFPVRQFRDVLATNFIMRERANFELFVTLLDKPYLSEFIEYFFEACEDKSMRELIIKNLIDQCCSNNFEFANALILTCQSKIYLAFTSSALAEKIKECIEQDKSIRIKKELIAELLQNLFFKDFLFDSLVIQKNKLNSTAIILSLLFEFDKVSLANVCFQESQKNLLFINKLLYKKFAVLSYINEHRIQNDLRVQEATSLLDMIEQFILVNIDKFHRFNFLEDDFKSKLETTTLIELICIYQIKKLLDGNNAIRINDLGIQFIPEIFEMCNQITEVATIREILNSESYVNLNKKLKFLHKENDATKNNISNQKQERELQRFMNKLKEISQQELLSVQMRWIEVNSSDFSCLQDAIF